jgi:hypothetical protein
MAGSRPGETNGRATGCTLINMFKPLPQSCIRLAIDYDFNAMGTELAKLSHLSYEEKLDFVSKVRSISFSYLSSSLCFFRNSSSGFSDSIRHQCRG